MSTRDRSFKNTQRTGNRKKLKDKNVVEGRKKEIYVVSNLFRIRFVSTRKTREVKYCLKGGKVAMQYVKADVRSFSDQFLEVLPGDTMGSSVLLFPRLIS